MRWLLRSSYCRTLSVDGKDLRLLVCNGVGIWNVYDISTGKAELLKTCDSAEEGRRFAEESVMVAHV